MNDNPKPIMNPKDTVFYVELTDNQTGFMVIAFDNQTDYKHILFESKVYQYCLNYFNRSLMNIDQSIFRMFSVNIDSTFKKIGYKCIKDIFIPSKED